MPNNNNQVTLTGYLGQDPEIIEARNGTTIAKLSIATSASYRDKSGEWQTNTDWHRVTAFGKTAENLTLHLQKGSLVSVSGRISYNKWTDKHEQTRTSTEIIVGSFTLLDKKKERDDRRTQQRRSGNEAPRKYTGRVPEMP